MSNRRRINRNKDRQFLEEPFQPPLQHSQTSNYHYIATNQSQNNGQYQQLQESEPYTYDKTTKLEQKTENYFEPHFIKKNVLNVFDDSYQQGFLQMAAFKPEENKKREPDKTQTNKYKITVQGELNEESEVQQRKKRVRKERKVIFEQQEVKDIQFEINEDRNEDREQDREQGRKQSMEKKREVSEQPMKSLQELVKQKKQERTSPKIVSLESLFFSCKTPQEKRRAIYTPLRPNEQGFCYFKRFDGMTATFSLLTNDGCSLMYSESQRGSIGCNYYISLTKEMDKSKPTYLGKLRGNALGSLYWLYDNGVQPREDVERSQWRATHLCVEYESNFLGMKGPRRIEVCCSNLCPRGLPHTKTQDSEVFKLSSEEEYKVLEEEYLFKYKNKKPIWNEKLGSYALNFGGRVKEPSIKNFILVKEQYSQDSSCEGENVVTFGKATDPFRFLKKRKKTVLKQSKANHSIEDLSSTIPKLSFNTYNSAKYSNRDCEKYLKSINFIQSISRLTEVESNQCSDSREQQKSNYQFQYLNQEQEHDPQIKGFIIKMQEQNTELKRCSICNRRFIIASYIKHTKVCQKIFFNRRKQFSSQNQRSKSKQLKK